MTVLQNRMNTKQVIFQCSTQHIWWSKIEKNTTVMSFVICFQTGVLWIFWWIKIQNRDIAIPTELNLFEVKTSVTKKMVFKKKNWPFLNVRETKTLTFTYDRHSYMSQIHLKLTKGSNRPIWENVATRNFVFQLWLMTEPS